MSLYVWITPSGVTLHGDKGMTQGKEMPKWSQWELSEWSYLKPSLSPPYPQTLPLRPTTYPAS